MDALGLEALGIVAPKEYKFYGGEITMQYDEIEHSYTRYDESGLVLIPGVTTVVKILDKSAALAQWAANMATDYVRANLDLNKTYNVEELEVLLNAARFNFKDYAEKAAETGKIAHSWLEQYIRADKRNDHEKLQLLMAAQPEDERARNGVVAALDFMHKHKVKWLYTERKIYSRTYDYAGTMDGLGLCTSCGDVDCTCCGYINAAGTRDVLHFENELAVIDWKTSNRLYDEYHYQTAAYLWAHAEEFPEQRAKLRIITRLGKEDAEFEARLLPETSFALDFQTYVQCLNLFRSIELGKRLNTERKAAEKAAVKSAKEAELRIACKKSDTFKGTRYPKCNDGPPCQTCLETYERRQAEKAKPVLGTELRQEQDGRELGVPPEALVNVLPEQQHSQVG